MLNDTLNTNEVKDSVGTEVEYERIDTNGRKTVFLGATSTPAKPKTLTVSHQESGSGIRTRRRSVIRFDEKFAGGVDTTVTEQIAAYVVLDAPVGNMTSTTRSLEILANLMSFLASDGSGTTILYAGTGSGAKALVNGTL